MTACELSSLCDAVVVVVVVVVVRTLPHRHNLVRGHSTDSSNPGVEEYP